MSPDPNPTIVLIGGTATLDSGATIDSRRPLAGDEWDVVLRQALGTSEAWWNIAKDFIEIVLAQDRRDDAWVLVWLSDKSLKRPRADGTFTRIRTQSVFGDIEDLAASQYRTDEGWKFRSDATASRYRAVRYLLRFEDMEEGPPPRVIVGGFHTSTSYDDGTEIVGARPLDYFVSRWPEALIVLPHTSVIEAKVRRVLANPPADRVVIRGVAANTHPRESQRYVKSLEDIKELHQADSFVVDHDFRITFWADQGTIRDPADLDAAFTFVKSRYDLNLGLWDLARDPVLRETLLTREGISAPMKRPAAVPRELATHASERAAERQEAKVEEKDARRRHHDAIWPTLKNLGWQKRRDDYRLAIGPDVSRYEGERVPSLVLALSLTRRQAVLGLYEPARTGRTGEFLRRNSDAIAAITGSPPDHEKQIVWRLPGRGWDAPAEGWAKDLATLETLVAALLPDLKPLGDAAADQIRNNRFDYAVEVPVSAPKPAAAEKESMWSRLRGKKKQ